MRPTAPRPGTTFGGGLVGPSGKAAAIDTGLAITSQFGRPSPAAPPAPAPPPAGGAAPFPMPWNTQYEQSVAGLGRTRDQQLAAIAAQQAQLGSTYGYDQAGNIDVSNPFSRRQLLVENYARARRGAGTSMAARGQLYSGAYQNQQNYLATQGLQAEDALKREYQDAAQALIAKRGQVQTGYDEGVDAAGWARLNAAAGELPEDPGVGGPAAAPPAAGPAAPAKAPVKRRGPVGVKRPIKPPAGQFKRVPSSKRKGIY